MCNFEGAVMQGPVVQLVRTPPCHGGGRGFESLPGRRCVMVVSAACQPFGLPLRDFIAYDLQALAAAVSKLPRQTKLSGRTYSRFARGLSSAGRAPALQAGGHRFEPCRPHIYLLTRGRAVRKLVGLITRRSGVQISPPLLKRIQCLCGIKL